MNVMYTRFFFLLYAEFKSKQSKRRHHMTSLQHYIGIQLHVHMYMYMYAHVIHVQCSIHM